MNLNELLPMSYENIVNQILNNLSSFSVDCIAQKNEITAFVKNPQNREAILSTYKTYGIPPANRPTKKRWPRKDIIYCDKFQPLQFFYAAKLKTKYPDIERSTGNCSKIKNLVTALDLERVNADKDRLSDPAMADAKLQILNDINTKYLSDFSQLDCPTYLDKIEQQEFKEQIKEQDEQSNKPTTTTYFIYGISGAIILISAIMLFRKK